MTVNSSYFVQTEAPLLIRPMIQKMTKSELHAVMVGGYATIAGSVMATYILFGVRFFALKKYLHRFVFHRNKCKVIDWKRVFYRAVRNTCCCEAAFLLFFMK